MPFEAQRPPSLESREWCLFQKQVNTKRRIGTSGPTLRIQCMVWLCFSFFKISF